MNLSELILRRRSIRKYTQAEIPEGKLNAVLQAGLLAPTSRNKKPCQFYVIRDREILKELSTAKKAGAGFLADAAAAIVVFGDEQISDVWVEDCSIALSYMNLMAEEQGLGSCWVQMRLRTSSEGKDAEAQVRRVLAVPDNYRVVGILSLGVPEKEAEPHSADEADWGKIHYTDGQL